MMSLAVLYWVVAVRKKEKKKCVHTRALQSARAHTCTRRHTYTLLPVMAPTILPFPCVLDLSSFFPYSF